MGVPNAYPVGRFFFFAFSIFVFRVLSLGCHGPGVVFCVDLLAFSLDLISAGRGFFPSI